CCPPPCPIRIKGRVPRASSGVHSTPGISPRVKNRSVTPSNDVREVKRIALQAFRDAFCGRSLDHATEGAPTCHSVDRSHLLESDGRRALVAAAVTVLLWASAFVSIRGAAPYFSPGALALGRLLAGAVALLAVWLVRREGWPARGAWPTIAVSGVLWFGVYMVALNWGEQQVDAGTAAMVVNIGPVLIALL